MKSQLDRRCWWCTSKLMRISHAEITDPDGNVYWVHKACENEAKAFWKPCTADHGEFSMSYAVPSNRE